MKDKNIDNLFNQYADDFAENQQLTQKAKMAMNAPRKKTLNWKALASALCCLVILVILSVAIFPKGDTNGGGTGDENDVTQNQPDYTFPGSTVVAYYSVGDVIGKSCNQSQIASFVNFQGLEQTGYVIVSERFYAFYFTDTSKGTDVVYYKAIFGVWDGNSLLEVAIIVESNGYVRNDWKEDYANYAQSQAVTLQGTNSRGEYVTKAFLKSQKVHFYVEILGGDTYVQRDIANKLLQS